MSRVLEILGICWSIAAFVAGVAFFFGGQWEDWQDIRDAHGKGQVINLPFPVPPSIEPIDLDGDGKTLEQDAVDKIFYSSAECQIGHLTVANLKADGDVPQIAICACADESIGNSAGRGWYCVE